MKNFKGIISIDAETNGLWGEPFAIAAIVYDEEYNEQDRFFARISDKFVTNGWVKENVLPTLSDLPITHQSLNGMLEGFARFWMKYKGEYQALWHMGHVVESYLFRLMVDKRIIGEWDAPYTFIEVSTALELAGEPADSVDGYAKRHNLELPDGSTHNPLYDCMVAAKVYHHLLESR